METFRIDAPIRELKEIKNVFQQNTIEKIRGVIDNSGVDYHENQQLVKRYDECVEDAKDIRDNIAALYFRLVLYLIIALALVTGGGTGIVGIVDGIIGLDNWHWETWVVFLFLVFILVMSIVLFYLAYRVIRYIIKGIIPLLSDKKRLKKQLDEKAEYAEKLCWDNARPFLATLNEFFTIDVMNETFEGICLNRYLDSRTVKAMERNAPNVFSHDVNETTVEMLCGCIFSNPFVIRKYRKHYMSTKKYEGSAKVYIDVWETDSKGNRVRTKKIETVTGYVVKPIPAYKDDYELLYTSNNAPGVSFTHGISKIPKIAREAAIDIKMRDHVKRNITGFTPMSNNPEFESLFFAIDRDDELQFRELFTPVAQMNMVDIIKDNEFGDYFILEKKRSLTKVQIKDRIFKSFSWEMWEDIQQFKDYDIRKIIEKVLEKNQIFLDKYLMMFMPILAVPYLQEEGDQYEEDFVEGQMHYSQQQAEVLANCMDTSVFVGKKTPIMVSAKYTGTEGRMDSYILDIHYYDTYPRIEKTEGKASDGSSHPVDVEWIEYIARNTRLYMMIKDTGRPKTTESSAVAIQKGFYKQGLFAYVSENSINQDVFDRKMNDALGI